jgi:hypothetical protein
MSAFHPLRTFGSSFIKSIDMKSALLILGILAVLLGLLWIGQGLGLVTWPASSFMIDQRPWVTRGVVLALVGIALIVASRRRR